MVPGRALAILLFLIPFFAIPYMVALRWPGKKESGACGQIRGCVRRWGQGSQSGYGEGGPQHWVSGFISVCSRHSTLAGAILMWAIGFNDFSLANTLCRRPVG